MATSNCRNCPDTYTVNTTRYSPAAISLPKQTAVCPTCGGLECLCRPRFFDGQLLSADDLTRLERYIVGKNRLHNRYLHGWGVVCGLEVRCDPCKDTVTVRKGYALSPCGDDIVVCKDVSVPICDLIKQCQRASADDCFSSQLTEAERGCQDAEVPWVLSICYDEKPSRGITPLRASSGSACCSKCACGGSSTCGCSCHETTSAAAQSTSRSAPAQCEPSVTCEGYRFTVSRFSTTSTNIRKKALGEMTRRYNACVNELRSILPEEPQDSNEPDQWRQYCCELIEAVRDFFSTHSSYDCRLDEKLATIACPPRPANMGSDEYIFLVKKTIQRIKKILTEYDRYCRCSAFLPPCPEPAEENCVPLAKVTIQRSGCRIVDVCNFSARRFAVTVPALSYWLSWAPVGEILYGLVGKKCCPTVRLSLQDVAPDPGHLAAGIAINPINQNNNTYSENESEAAAPKESGILQVAQETVQVFAQAYASRSVEFDSQILLEDAMGARGEDNLPFLSVEERRNPLTTLIANEIAVPLVNAFMPKKPGDISNLARAKKVKAAEAEKEKIRKADSAKKAAAGAPPTELEELQARLEALKRVVDHQQQTIDTLAKRQARKD
jgi:hypothetical protein